MGDCEAALREKTQETMEKKRKSKRKDYTLESALKSRRRDPKPYTRKPMAERHEGKVENIIENYRIYHGHNLRIYPADIVHYDKRLAEYDRLTARLAELDPLKDYAERNMINYKLRVIREDFERMRYYSKMHDGQSYEYQGRD